MNRRFYLRFITPVIIALIVPMISYTVIRMVQRDKDEKLITSMYERQLNSILFSVNQHCWDMFRSWVIELTSISSGEKDDSTIHKQLTGFTGNRPYITKAIIRYPSGKIFLFCKHTADKSTSCKPDS